MRTDAALVQHRHLASVAPLRLVADRHLVEEIHEGSERAFEELFKRHRGPLLDFCRRLLGSREDAEDIVQQTFLVAWGEISRDQGPRALRPWLYGIARHRCLTLLRARRVRFIQDGPEPTVDDLAARVTTRDELGALLTDLARLPDDQRAALVLAELGDVSHEEIARRLGCRREKVKALTYQARSSLAAGRRARETPCSEIREQLATLRGAALRRASLRRHLRECAGCRMFRDELRAQRSLVRAVPSLVPIAALKQIILKAASDSGGAGAGVAALGSSAVSAAGLVATAAVTVAIPIAGISVALSARGNDRAASPTHAAVADGRYGPAPARAHPSASGGPREISSVTTPPRTARAGNRPPRAAESGTGPAPAAGATGGGREDSDATSSPGGRESKTPSQAVRPPDVVAPRRPSPRPVPETPAAPSPPPTPDSQRPPAPSRPSVPAAPPGPRGRPRPEHPAQPAAPSPPSPAPRPAPDERSAQPPPARPEPPMDPAPRTDAGPSSPAPATPGGPPSGHDGERGTSGPPAAPGDHRP
jgi:RNA polymerase sigma factor (sigma-70 family)